MENESLDFEGQSRSWFQLRLRLGYLYMLIAHWAYICLHESKLAPYIANFFVKLDIIH